MCIRDRWKAFPLAAEVEALTQLPTVVDNNGKSVALGEAWCGAAVGLTDFVAVVMGAGVGGGIISGGKLLEGRMGNAGHIGHIVVEPEGRDCACGGRGCLEAYCSGRAIEEETGRPPQRAPQSIVERTGILAGRALASLGAICDLRLAVIGGSVALGFGEPFFGRVQDRSELRRPCADDEARPKCGVQDGHEYSGKGNHQPPTRTRVIARPRECHRDFGVSNREFYRRQQSGFGGIVSDEHEWPRGVG